MVTSFSKLFWWQLNYFKKDIVNTYFIAICVKLKSESLKCKCSPGFELIGDSCLDRSDRNLFIAKSQGIDIYNSHYYATDSRTDFGRKSFSIYRVPVKLEYNIELPVVTDLIQDPLYREHNPSIATPMIISKTERFDIFLVQILKGYGPVITQIKNWQSSNPEKVVYNHIVTSDIYQVSGIAIAEQYDLLYFADLHKTSIEVVSISSKKKTLLFRKDLNKPRELAIDLNHNRLFWFDTPEGSNSDVIYMGSTDGQPIGVSTIHKLVTSLTAPKCLTLSPVQEILLWLNSHDSSISMVKIGETDYGTGQRKIFPQQSDFTPQIHTFAWLNDKIYFQDRQHPSIQNFNLTLAILREPVKVNKMNIISTGIEQMMVVDITRASVTVQRSCNDCKDGLCLPGKNGPTCRPETGLTLVQNQHKTSLLYVSYNEKSSVSNLKRYTLNPQSSNNIPVSYFDLATQMSVKNSVAIGTYKKEIIIANKTGGIFTLDLAAKKFEKFINFNHDIIDMVSDPFTGNVFFLSKNTYPTENADGSSFYQSQQYIYVGRSTQTKFYKLFDPYADENKKFLARYWIKSKSIVDSIAVHFETGYLYWSVKKLKKNRNNNSCFIYRASIHNVTSTVQQIWKCSNEPEKKYPYKMHIKGNSLYVAAENENGGSIKDSTIYELRLDGGSIGVRVPKAGYVGSFLEHENELFWTDLNSKRVMSHSLTEKGRELFRIYYAGEDLSQQAIGMTMLEDEISAPSKSYPCSYKNGGCSGICLVKTLSPSEKTSICYLQISNYEPTDGSYGVLPFAKTYSKDALSIFQKYGIAFLVVVMFFACLALMYVYFKSRSSLGLEQTDLETLDDNKISAVAIKTYSYGALTLDQQKQGALGSPVVPKMLAIEAGPDMNATYSLHSSKDDM